MQWREEQAHLAEVGLQERHLRQYTCPSLSDNGTDLALLVLTPGTSESILVCQELWFREARPIAQGSGRVGNALLFSLGGDVLLNMLLQVGIVLVSKAINYAFEYEGTISCPGVEICQDSR